jgi:2,3-bisphosphoglycerate-dependent phosphoglycerate mutase
VPSLDGAAGAHRYLVAMADDDTPTEYRQHRFRPPPGSCEVLLVRHGESAPAVEGRPFPLVDGHGDPELAPDGRWQAERVGERLADDPIAAIYVTTLRRTHETAAPLAARLGIEPVVVPDLREVHLGEWEGESIFRKKFAEGDPISIQVMIEERWDAIPGAESNEALAGRVVPALQAIADTHPDQRVAVVVHGGVIGSALAHATGARPFAFVGADNGSISHLVVFGDRWILRRYNDTGHLDGELSAEAEPLT